MIPDFDPLTVLPAEIPAALARIAAEQSALAAQQAALAARLVAVPAVGDGHGAQSAVRLLTVYEAAAKLSVTSEWLYRRGKRLGLAVKLDDGTLRFSEAALDDYIKRQTVSAAPARRRRAS